MDSLTQIVLGAAVGEAVLGRKAGNKALLYGAIAGTIPDLDILANSFTDTITAIEVHRGFSHSLPFAILMAPLLGWLVNKIERKKNLGWRSWAWLFFWGLVTHPLLDIFTTWGTQFFWPLDERFALNSIFVIDPLYTLPFFICTAAVMFYQPLSRKRKIWNRTGLLLSSGYLLLTLALKQSATNQFKQALDDQNIAYERISTRPAALNTILWNANVETADAYLIADYSFFDSQPISYTRYPKQREKFSELIQQPNVLRLTSISKGWFLITAEDGQVYFNDLRFGLAPSSDGKDKFVFSYLLTEEDGVITATEREKSFDDGQKLLSQLWERIKGN
jgi:inner membrane protein